MTPHLTAQDVARILNVSPRQAYKLMEEERIPGVHRFGRSIRVSQEGLSQYIRSCAVKPNPARFRAASALYEARRAVRNG